MLPEFLEEAAAAQGSPTKRPKVQADARAIQQSIRPIKRRESDSGLAYPYPGKGVSGESSN